MGALASDPEKPENRKIEFEIILLAVTLLLVAIVTFDWLGDNLSRIAGQIGIVLLIVLIVLAAVKGVLKR